MSDLDRVVTALREFAAERDWRQFHDPKNLAMALSSEVGELCALYRWVRTDDADNFSQDPTNRAQIQDELADVTIFLLLLADRTGHRPGSRGPNQDRPERRAVPGRGEQGAGGAAGAGG